MKVDVFDTQEAMVALHRAAAMARKTAIDTNTHLVVMENGKIVHISAQQLREDARDADTLVNTQENVMR